MKLVILFLLVCGYAFIYAQQMTVKQVMQALEQEFKREIQEVKNSGQANDKELIAKLKTSVQLMAKNVDKSPPEYLEPIKKLVGVLEAKLKKMESSGKFDESALNISKDF